MAKFITSKSHKLVERVQKMSLICWKHKEFHAI